MSSDAPLLELASITVRRGKTTVLESVDLAVQSGDVVVLVGENGAGKSTLIEAAAGILNLSAGAVKHGGHLVRDSEGRRNWPPPFGLTLQSGGFCQDELLKERIATAVAVSNRTASEQWISDELDKWGLRHRAEDRIAWLSGGMKRKIGVLAGLTPALVSDSPRLILLDEPSEGLDEKTIETLKSEIAKLAAIGHAFVIATHDEDLLSLATRTVTVRRKSLEKGEQKQPRERWTSAKKDDSQNTIVSRKKPSYSAHFTWPRNLEKRTKITTINRSVSGIIALVVVVGMLSQIEPPTNRAWLALLALTPALISAFVRPGFLTHLNDSRAGDWWNAHLGGRMQMKDGRPIMVVIPFTIALISCNFVFGEVSFQTIIVALCLASITIGSSRIHSLESTFPRQGASLILLLLAILVWPFLLAVDLLAIPPGDFVLNAMRNEILITLSLPIVIWFLTPQIAGE
jgi:ABC-type multidrug transport system ATPase subunit